MFALPSPSEDPLQDEIDRFIQAILWTALGVLTLLVVLFLIAFLVGRSRANSPGRAGRAGRADSGPLLGLHELLMSLFQPDELRRILHLWLRNGEELVHNLPINTTPAEFVYAAVVAVHQRGLIDALFAALMALRPERLEDIRRVQHAMAT